MGKTVIVAERHRKLARHNVPGKDIQKTRVLKGRREWFYFSGISAVPCGTDSFRLVEPGTLSLANLRRRFATVIAVPVNIGTVDRLLGKAAEGRRSPRR